VFLCHQARGQKRKIGWFPANYVKLLGGSARSTPDNTLVSSGKSSPAIQAVSGALMSSDSASMRANHYHDWFACSFFKNKGFFACSKFIVFLVHTAELR